MNLTKVKRLAEAEAAFIAAFGPPAPCPVLPPAMVDEGFAALAVLRATPGFWLLEPEDRAARERAVKLLIIKNFTERKTHE